MNRTDMYVNEREKINPNSRQEQELEQHWTVHAEFTISHDGLTEQGIGPPTTHTECDENGVVRLVYHWTSVQTHSTVDEPRNTETKPTLLFTEPSAPPKIKPQSSSGGYVRNILNKFSPSNHQQQENPISSGYSSEQLMSPSNSSSAMNNGNRLSQQQQQQLYNRRCRSTCSIVLSTNVNAATGPQQPQQAQPDPSPSRSQSLRCQTTSAVNKQEAASSLYGCGDPWCYHSPHYDESLARFSPLIEADEYAYAPTASIKSTTTKNSAFLSTNKCCRDASVQTYEMVDKCTSPFLPITGADYKSSIVSGKLNVGVIGPKKRPGYLTRRKTEPIRRTNKGRESHQLPSMSPDSLETKQDHVKRFVEQQLSGVRPSRLPYKVTSGGDTQTDKKSRTVHIDVYCTGTERESSSSSASTSTTSDDNNNEQVSSPQTVFESSDVRITHVRADPNALPQRIINQTQASLGGEEEEEEDVDSAYPSRLSSYSAIRDFDLLSSFSTNPWSRMSLSSCDTSWKDTTGSDLVSLMEGPAGRSNRLIGCVDPITEEDTTLREKIQTPSSFDSFEYAASDDKVRIRRLNKELIKWRSPQIERQKMLLQKSMVEEVAPHTHSSDDSSDSSDKSGKGWSFVKTNLAREDTIKQRLPPAQQKSPSVLIVKQKMTENPELRAPFTRSPGVFTEQREVARRFGRIIDVYKKPGHHIGPAKNPDCSCDHCTEHFRGGFGGRGRTQSVSGGGGSGPIDYYSWKRGGKTVVGRGSEPPQSREEIRLQLQLESNTAMYGLARNASLSNI